MHFWMNVEHTFLIAQNSLQNCPITFEVTAYTTQTIRPVSKPTMIDPTISSDDDSKHAELSYESDKENLEPIKKRPFQMSPTIGQPHARFEQFVGVLNRFIMHMLV